MTVIDSLLTYLQVAVPLALLGLLCLLVVVQRYLLGELERRGALRDVVGPARKAGAALGIVLCVAGGVWLLQTAGLLDVSKAARYILPASVVIVGLLILYLSRPGQASVR